MVLSWNLLVPPGSSCSFPHLLLAHHQKQQALRGKIAARNKYTQKYISNSIGPNYSCALSKN